MDDVYVPLVEGKVNIISNVHASFLAFKRCSNGLILSIRYPKILKERYNIKNAVWLTRESNCDVECISPDRLDFEIMERVVEYISSGGKCILIDGVEYLAAILGIERVCEWIRRIKSLGKDLTIVISVNGRVDKWSMIADFTHTEIIGMQKPMVLMVNDKPDKVLSISLESGKGRISVNEFRSVDMFLEIGVEKIRKRVLGKNVNGVFVECMDYLLSMSSESRLMEFMKSLIDIVTRRGGKVYIKRAGGIFNTPLVSLFDSLGIEESEIFVGREKEMEDLRKIIDEVEMSGRAVIISGEEGIGKTTLVMRAKNYALMKGFTFLQSKSYYSSGEPYLPIMEAFGREIGGLIGEEYKPKDRKELEYQRNAMFYDLKEKIRRIAEKRKMMIFLDDIHWMDSSSLKLLHYLISNLRNVPVLFVCAYRKEEISESLRDVLARMHREKLYHGIELDVLEYEEIKRIVNYLTNTDVPDEFAKVIYEKSGGNPLFAKEVVLALMKEGLLNPGRGIFPKKVDISVPDLVRSIVDRRLGMLNDEEKKIVEFAATYGYRVEPEVLAKAMSIDEMELVDAMERISEVGIWHENPKIGMYIFRERIIRDGIYDDLSKTKRKLMHRRIAHALEEIHRDEEKYLIDLANHYGLGGIEEKAYEYFVRAAEHAEAMYAHEDAIELYERALEMSVASEKKERVHSLLGEIYRITGDYKKALKHLKEALEIAQRREDKRSIAEHMVKIGNITERMGNEEEARKFYYEAMGLVDENDPLMATISMDMAWFNFRRGKMEDAIQLAKKGVKVAERSGDKGAEGFAYHILGTIYWQVGEYGEAERYLKIAMRIREDTKDLYGLVTDYNNLGVLYNDMGRTDMSLEYYEKAFEILKKIGYLHGSAIVVSNIGGIYGRRGDLQRALEHFLTNLSISEKIGDWYGMALAYINIGGVYMDWGLLDEAMYHYKKSLELREEHEEKEGIASSYNSIGTILYFKGNIEDAIEMQKKALKIAEEISAQVDIESSIRNLAVALFEKGEREKAMKLLKEGMDIATRLNCKECLYNEHIALAEIEIEMGKFKEASEHARKSMKFAEEMNSKIMKTHSLRLLGRAIGELGEVEEGEKYLKEAISLSKEMDTRGNYALCLRDLALVKISSGGDEGWTLLKEAMKMLDELGYKLYVEKIKNILNIRK